jgi:pimeloyl-ACP methyl ester carboxylesterase
VTGNPQALTISNVGVLADGPDDAEETIVYLHGWGASKELWWNSLALLSDRVRGYALDLPGTGETPLGHRFESMAELAAWTVAVCRRLGLTRTMLVGHSLGGNLAAQIALDFPDFVSRLVLVDAALATKSLPRRVYWTQSATYGIPAIRAMRIATGPLAMFGANVPHNHRGGFLGPLARRAGLFIAANKSDASLQAQLKLLCGNPLDAVRLGEIRAPIMIVHGGLDGVIPVGTAKAYAAALPGCRFKLFATSHHCPMDHDPALFTEILRDFIRDTAQEPTPNPLPKGKGLRPGVG